MSDFQKWFADQDFYTNMRFIHGDALFLRDGFVYRVLPVQMTYVAWDSSRTKTKDGYVVVTQEWHTKGWKARQSEIDQLKAEKAGVQKRFNFLLNKNICNESDHASLKLRAIGLLSKWKKDSEHADSVASEDFVQNVLDACIDDLEKALRGEHETN